MYVKSFLSLLCLALSISISAQTCNQVFISDQLACSSDFFEAKNLSDLGQYLNQGKFRDGKLLNLRLNFNLTLKNVNFDIPCKLKLAAGKKISSTLHPICIKAVSIETEGLNQIKANDSIRLIATESILLKGSSIFADEKIELKNLSTNKIDDHLNISNLVKLEAREIQVDSKTNLVISSLSSFKSKNIILNGQNCEIHKNLETFKGIHWIGKKFKPNFKFTGSCSDDIFSEDLEIVAKKLDLNQSWELSVIGTDESHTVQWLINDSEYLGDSSNVNFPYAGRHSLNAIISNSAGQFKRISKAVDVGFNQIKNKQLIIFKYVSGNQVPSLNAKLGEKNIKLYQSKVDRTLYTQMVDIYKNSTIQFKIPSIGFKTETMGEKSGEIDLPEEYILAKIDEVLSRANNTNIRNALLHLKARIATLSLADKALLAEILAANLKPLDVQTTKNNIFKTILNNVLIPNAYCQDQNTDVVTLNEIANFLRIRSTLVYRCGAGIVAGLAILAVSESVVEDLAAGLALLAVFATCSQDASAAQESLNQISIPQNNSFRINPSKITSDQDTLFSLSAMYLPADYATYRKTFFNNTTVQSIARGAYEINSALTDFNGALSILPIFSSFQIPLVEPYHPPFEEQISARFINNVTIKSTPLGGVSIKSFSNQSDSLKLNIKSNLTQLLNLSFTYTNLLLGPTIQYTSDLRVEVPPKAHISYSTNGLKVNLNSSDPTNPNTSNLTYDWDFGDGTGTSTNSKNVSHTFEKTGFYTVRLKVTDLDGVSSEDSILLDLSEINYSFFLQVNVLGTYLFVDTVGGIQPETDIFLQDIKVAPTSIDLIKLYSEINLREGDKIVMQAVGVHIPGPDHGNVAKGLLAVFRGIDGSFISPGPGGNQTGIVSPNTYPVGIPTDIGQDFIVSEQFASTVEIPIGAASIAFSPIDSFFRDNTDPDNDYGVSIKITIIRSSESLID